MSAHSALEEPGSQQHLATNTREVTLVTSRNALVPQATSSLPFPSPAAERGDVTLRESASGTAAIVDAQPTALVADSLDSEHLESHPGVLDGRMRPAAGQSVDVSCPSPGTAASSGVSQSALDASSTQEPHGDEMVDVMVTRPSLLSWGWDSLSLDGLPNEVLMHILTFLDVSDLLATSRINHHFRTLCLHPILHTLRLRRARVSLPPLLTSPSRPTLAELIARHIFLTHTTQISRRLARNLVAIRLSRRLPLRPSAESLVQRGVLPPEIVEGNVAPGLVAKKRAVEKERLKDGLRRWVGAVWRGEVRERSEGVKKWEERAGVGRVWRLRRFWERVGKDSDDAPGVL
ncbi:uncharacterized protein F4807DRAFT_375660 [Annulohypoxylon truncatum]|uniref:uncharacterized protein n=1 Tax=Annulohypoxylon truncatum TaxID=327061 RepID=UPI0020085EED|nr:uncharacterized protein F4807DRAFT_375660 [Annulohypoxylon truncatum]KAI1204085.1 hypothetical protein F4807DRAFT_375660 [Annulohypoxylon truncatum]